MKYPPFVRAKNEEDRCVKSNCPYEHVEGSDYCSRHGANKQIEKRANQMRYEFKKERVRSQVQLLAAEPTRYRLDEELAILRMTLQDTINTVTTESDREYALFQCSDTIRNLVTAIDKTAQTCVQQSVNLGLLMTTEDVLAQVQAIIDVLAEEIKDEEALLRIAEKIDSVISVGGLKIEGNNDPLQLDGPTSLD